MADDQSSRPADAPQVAAGPQPATAPDTGRKKLRGRLFAGLGLVVVLVAIAVGIWWLVAGSRYASTDNAYVGADVAQVTPLISGAVTEVKVADTQTVKAGDVLVEIDSSDAKLAVAQAEAEYAQAVRKVRGFFASNQNASADIATRDAEVARAKAQTSSAASELDKTRVDLQRREALSASGAVSGEEVTSARTAVKSAEAAVAAARAAEAAAAANRIAAQAHLQTQTVLTEGTDVESNPETAVAKAKLDIAKLDLDRTVVRAP
ncbi:MAG: biotin/lipoyl-binding protein, partial [Caulobacteraceae bacterium]